LQDRTSLLLPPPARSRFWQGYGGARHQSTQASPYVHGRSRCTRDIEVEVAELDDVFLYTVDDLSHVVQEGMDSRQTAVTQAEAIIDTSVDSFMHWMETRELVPLSEGYVIMQNATAAMNLNAQCDCSPAEKSCTSSGTPQPRADKQIPAYPYSRAQSQRFRRTR